MHLALVVRPVLYCGRSEPLREHPVLCEHHAAVLSGLAEIGLGGLLLFEGWSRLAAWGLIALLIAVFPANVNMALHPELYPWASSLGLWLRLFLQGLLIAWAYWYTRGH